MEIQQKREAKFAHTLRQIKVVEDNHAATYQ
jgi:hypothetical protein